MLNYIRNESRRFQTYVANRVTEIRELTFPHQWRHCPGAINPADDASRGLRIEEFLRSERWLKGPPFLRQSEDQWPENRFEDVSPDVLELKKAIYSTGLQPPSPVEELIDRSSDWVQTLRRVDWLLKYLDWLRWRAEKNAGRKTEVKYVERKIENEDLERAKRRIAAVVSARSFPKEAIIHSYYGVDYFGPFYVKRGRGRVIEKRWGAIFVCLNSRAVHLEVAKSLETDDFMLVLIRFPNRRGHVKEIRSDNGTNFVGAEREIRESLHRMNHRKLENDLMQSGCKGVFHHPRSIPYVWRMGKTGAYCKEKFEGNPWQGTNE